GRHACGPTRKRTGACLAKSRPTTGRSLPHRDPIAASAGPVCGRSEELLGGGEVGDHISGRTGLVEESDPLPGPRDPRLRLGAGGSHLVVAAVPGVGEGAADRATAV